VTAASSDLPALSQATSSSPASMASVDPTRIDYPPMVSAPSAWLKPGLAPHQLTVTGVHEDA
jgi:hypothetical protein